MGLRSAVLAALLASAVFARAESLPEFYAPYGQLIVTQMTNAPFPHPKRAEGHVYKGKMYSAAEHYSDSTVALFVPKDLRATARLDVVVHFHGWNNHVEGVLRRYKLIEQLAASHRNAVLVVPQGPSDAPDSFGGKLEDADGFKRFMDEVTATLKSSAALPMKDFSVGDIILSGHSGGYQVISSIVDHGGLADQIREVWLFDALYAQTDRFAAWFEAHDDGRLIDLYTEHGGTKEESEQLMDRLDRQDVGFYFGTEEEATPAVLRSGYGIYFLFSSLEHNDVVDKQEFFRRLLETSFLEPTKAGKKSE